MTETQYLDLSRPPFDINNRGRQTLTMTADAFGRKLPSVLVPPINFALVAPGVYRSGHPNKKNFPFLLGLSLKTIVYVESTAYRPDSQVFVDSCMISLHTFDLSSESNLFTAKGKKEVEDVVRLLLDKRNHPVLIHDDMGKSTVSLVCALIRRLQRWSLTGIFAEGDMFAGHAGGSEGTGIGEAGREVSQGFSLPQVKTQRRSLLTSNQFIAMFNPRKLGYEKAHAPDWID